MRSFLLPLGLLLGAAPLLAQQTTVAVRTDGPVSVWSDAGSAADFTSVGNGTAVGSGSAILNLRARVDQGNDWASSTTIAYPTLPSRGAIGVNFFERAYVRGPSSMVAGSSASATAGSATHGPHALLLTFGNQPGTVGTLVFSFRASSTGAAKSASLDVGNDGSVEVQAVGSGLRQELPITIPASGSFDVRITNEARSVGAGSAAGMQTCWTELWVGFLPDRTASCTFTNYGQGCGPAVSGTDAVIGTNRVLTFLVTGAFPNEPVVAVTGSGPLSLPLPGGCSLLAQIEVAVALTADANGLATHTEVFPATLTGSSWHQFLPVRLSGPDVVISTSNGLRVDCR